MCIRDSASGSYPFSFKILKAKTPAPTKYSIKKKAKNPIRIFIAMLVPKEAERRNAFDSVSYTYIDVYKRQVICF